ncbi:MAG TPA: ABC transporter permease [Myxococcales bacterium]|jgi:ABC-type nitrate/sulfonate/bicarbonate transport system permease component|nr:ABC transporter permease [Myxococcales bacterium]
MIREQANAAGQSFALAGGAPGPRAGHKSLWTRFAASTLLVKIAGGVFLLVVSEIAVRLLAPAYVSRPSGVFRVLPQTLTNPAVLSGAAITLGAVLQGSVVALVSGMVVGLLMGRIRLVDRLLRIYVDGLSAMPMVAIVPLLTIWFGFTSWARLATVIFAAFFPIAINMNSGARAVPQGYLEVARSCGASAWHTLFGVTLPASMPYLLSGIRLALGRALVGAVVAEFYVSVDGLGYFILFQTRTFHHNEAFVAVLLLALVAVGVDALINGIIRRYMPWYRAGERKR